MHMKYYCFLPVCLRPIHDESAAHFWVATHQLRTTAAASYFKFEFIPYLFTIVCFSIVLVFVLLCFSLNVSIPRSGSACATRWIYISRKKSFLVQVNTQFGKKLSYFYILSAKI